MMISNPQPSKELHWENLFKEWKSSGKTVGSWCKERSIPQNTFRYWKDKFSPPKIDKKAFIEVIDVEEKTLGLTILYKDFEIQIHKKFDDKTLSRCLAVIRGVRC